MLNQEIDALNQALGLYAQQKAKRNYAQKLMLFGGKFTDEISKASNEEELADAMIQANKMAYLAGVPELSNQINNLGRLQEAKISNQKKEYLAGEIAEMTANAYGFLPTILDGEPAELQDRPEWKAVAKAPVELQGAMYEQLAKRYKAEVSGVVEKLSDNSYGYTEWIIDPYTKEYKMTKQLRPVTGGYDDALTTTEVEMLQEPFQIGIQRLKDKEQMEAFDLQMKKYEISQANINARADRKLQQNYEEIFKNPAKFKTYENQFQSELKTAEAEYNRNRYSGEIDWITQSLLALNVGDLDFKEQLLAFSKNERGNPENTLANLKTFITNKGYGDKLQDAIEDKLIAPYEVDPLAQEKYDLAKSNLEYVQDERLRLTDPAGYEKKQRKKAEEEITPALNLYKLSTGKNILEITNPKIAVDY